MNFNSLDRVSVYRILVVSAAVTLILIGCVMVLQPFIASIVLAVILALATWPAYARLVDYLKGRNTLAAGLMTLGLVICFLIPLVLVGSSLSESFSTLSGMVTKAMENPTPALPDAIKNLPVIGAQAEHMWSHYIQDREQLLAVVQKQTGDISNFLVSVGAAIARGMLDVAVALFIAFFLFRNGPLVAGRFKTLIERFGGERGTRLLLLSKNTLVGVVYGLLATALAQGMLATLGFWIAGVPGAPLLGLLTLFLSLLPVGPPLIWIPATVWLFTEGQIGMAIFMGMWGVLAISMIDNLIRPFFISMGSNLPILLVLLGVFGGIVAFGFIGLFVGPTLLAIAYALILDLTQRRAAEAFPAAN